MKIDRNRMNMEEKVMLELHTLYQQYGYSRYKMGKFENYDLYVQNKDFISTDSIIAFNDPNGKLLALKPDLTLSIVKNYRYLPGFDQKVFYSENIYRADRSSHDYKEIMQTGLECMGDIGLYDTFEVTMLAARSLAAISSDYVLEVSHMGLVEDLLEPIDPRLHDDIIRCLSEKNGHEIRRLCEANDVDPDALENLEILVSTYGDFRRVLKKLSKLKLTERGQAAIEQLRDVLTLMASYKLSSRVNVDFSIVNDLNYYSGILLKGFVNGIPKPVLSGGQYDKLMTRMGKKGGALGFAVYLDGLDHLDRGSREYDVDVVFQYTLEDDLTLMYKAVRKLTQSGATVLVEKQIPSKLRYRRLVRLSGSEVVTVEQND